jgi:hypothetical protein
MAGGSESTGALSDSIVPDITHPVVAAETDKLRYVVWALIDLRVEQ